MPDLRQNTNIISNIVKPAEMALSRANEKLPSQHPPVTLKPEKPPIQDTVQLSLALENNVRVFQESIIAMRENHARLIDTYSKEIIRMRTGESKDLNARAVNYEKLKKAA